MAYFYWSESARFWNVARKKSQVLLSEFLRHPASLATVILRRRSGGSWIRLFCDVYLGKIFLYLRSLLPVILTDLAQEMFPEALKPGFERSVNFWPSVQATSAKESGGLFRHPIT